VISNFIDQLSDAVSGLITHMFLPIVTVSDISSQNQQRDPRHR
jgi:hypothetical protein